MAGFSYTAIENKRGVKKREYAKQLYWDKGSKRRGTPKTKQR
jgi:hypothetical protein